MLALFDDRFGSAQHPQRINSCTALKPIRDPSPRSQENAILRRPIRDTGADHSFNHSKIHSCAWVCIYIRRGAIMPLAPTTNAQCGRLTAIPGHGSTI